MAMKAAALFLTLTATAAAAEPPTPTRGVQTGDLNKGVSPCTDFYEYANGAWRASNPIPPSMVRWSRRWAARIRRMAAPLDPKREPVALAGVLAGR